MIAYASRTGTRTTRNKLLALGWRLMLSAKGSLHTAGMRYALDNGAWHAHANGRKFDETAFVRALKARGEDADFAVVPDIVGAGLQSMECSLRWLERLRAAPCSLMLAVQDGMASADVSDLVGPLLGIFVGGTTLW